MICFFDRYYDPTTAQWLSVDPLIGMTGEPYAFTGDDPINRTDPNGMNPSCGPAVGACVESASGVPEVVPSPGPQQEATFLTTVAAITTNTKAAVAVHEGADSADAMASNQYQADKVAQSQYCVASKFSEPIGNTTDAYECHEDLDALSCTVTTGLSFLGGLIFIGGVLAIVAIGPFAAGAAIVTEATAEGGTDAAIAAATQAARQEAFVNYGGAAAQIGGSVLATTGAIGIIATC